MVLLLNHLNLLYYFNTGESQKRKDEIETLKEYAGHGFKYGGSSTQITQMMRRAKMAEKLEEKELEEV